MESLSISGNSDGTEESTTDDHSSTCAETPAATGRSSLSQAWEGPDAAPEMEGLWRASPKVAGGAGGKKCSKNLCEAGVLAEQGNFQPRGKVVFILEHNPRVSILSEPLTEHSHLWWLFMGTCLLPSLLKMPRMLHTGHVDTKRRI